MMVKRLKRSNKSKKKPKNSGSRNRKKKKPNSRLSKLKKMLHRPGSNNKKKLRKTKLKTNKLIKSSKRRDFKAFPKLLVFRKMVMKLRKKL